MIIPKIKVGESFYKTVKKRMKDDDGLCNVVRKEITIDPTACGSIESELTILFHEVFHAVYDHFNINQIVDPKYYEEVIEIFTESSGKGMLMLMVDNPGFFRHVLSEIEKKQRRKND